MYQSNMLISKRTRNQLVFDYNSVSAVEPHQAVRLIGHIQAFIYRVYCMLIRLINMNADLLAFD